MHKILCKIQSVYLGCSRLTSLGVDNLRVDRVGHTPVAVKSFIGSRFPGVTDEAIVVFESFKQSLANSSTINIIRQNNSNKISMHTI